MRAIGDGVVEWRLNQMICSHCQGTVIREDDPYDGPRMVCLQCGRTPRITPLGDWLAKVERPTEEFWPSRKNQHRIPPPTRKYQ